ncbi:MAG: hypothetical protein R3F02_22130 [Thiolinea sp.]
MCRSLLIQLSKTALLMVAASGGVHADDQFYIAGTIPYERPAGAPVINEFNKNGNWYSTALWGVEKPYPYSLRFLEDQGQWHTPFNHPGMTSRYDIRHWHQPEN